MKIDFATLAFGYQVLSGGNTPNWATALGQGKEHKINDTNDIIEILKGMLYCGVPVSLTKTKIGKGKNMFSGDDESAPISMSAVFNKVYINDTLIKNGKFILIITKDLTGFHKGRFKLKYGPSNTYENGNAKYTNQLFFDQVKSQLKLADDACWFVSDINVRNQDELIFTTYVIKEDGPVTYADGKALHAAWSSAAPFISPYKGSEEELTETAGNILLYGVPGCGKSYTIKTEYCDDENVMERIVFHPDYTNSDFIGQILPQNKNGNISYHFIPGPFTRIMKKAYQNPDEMHYLVIEEINRGNAPAIFGEVFQLLDRENGESTYGINNADIAREIYLKNKETASEEEIKEAEAHIIKIPANLTVLATMNTADQNVFTLDTAFKRRWKMRCIKNNFDECDRSEEKIGNTEITWRTFAEVINNNIASESSSAIASEDKRLGAYFVSKEELQENRFFAEKVLAYLWDDVFKYKRDKIFSGEVQLLDELIDKFEACGMGAFSIELQTELKSY